MRTSILRQREADAAEETSGALRRAYRPKRGASNPRVLIIDNYDSFVYNLYQRVGELTGNGATVLRNDRFTLRDVEALNPTHIIISPGPGNPENGESFGLCREVIVRFGQTTPVLGVCLGHQGIGAAFGARIIRADRVMHGKTSLVLHDGTHTFRGIENPTVVMRYHSLVVDRSSLPSDLVVNAMTEDGTIMGMFHRHYPIHGVQFHPESIGSRSGTLMLKNFVESAGSGVA